MSVGDPLEELLHSYLEAYLAGNHAARVVAKGLRIMGVGFRPAIDHISFQTLDIDGRAREFIELGCECEPDLGLVHGSNWWAKIYRKEGYPALLIRQPIKDERVRKSTIPDWVAAHGDKNIFYVSVRVEDIESAVFFLEKQGIPFADKIVGDKQSDLRQVFAVPEIRDGKALSLFGLAERHRGFQGIVAQQLEELMRSIHALS
jgi:hypothetical protein